MSWKDTVIKKHKYAEAQYMGDRFLQILSEQAEISYKAGQENGCYAEGWANGIQEVVDTVWNESVGDPRITGYIRIVWKDWKAILKKWGIK